MWSHLLPHVHVPYLNTMATLTNDAINTWKYNFEDKIVAPTIPKEPQLVYLEQEDTKSKNNV